MLKAVLFDMDGVIVDTEPLHKKAYYQMFDYYNIVVPDTLFEMYTGQSTINICNSLCDRYKLDSAPESLVQKKRDFFKDIFFNDGSLKLIDGVLEVIKDYHANGLTLVLASSASMQTIDSIFDRFDLSQYFKAKISGADLAFSKPYPEIFEKAAVLAGFDRSECLVIEDSTNGIKAAKAASIYCVGYDSFYSKNQDYSLADIVVSDFMEISYEKINGLFEMAIS